MDFFVNVNSNSQIRTARRMKKGQLEKNDQKKEKLEVLKGRKRMTVAEKRLAVTRMERKSACRTKESLKIRANNRLPQEKRLYDKKIVQISNQHPQKN